MDFRLTEEQEMIAETLGAALADLAGSRELRRMIDAGETFSAPRWRALAELGLCGVLAPEDAGGLGLTEIEFAGIAERCGFALLPEPLTESAGVALPLLAELRRSEFADAVAGLAAGEGHVALFHPDMPLAPHAETARLVIVADEDGGLAIGKPAEMGLTRQPAADPLTPLFSAAPGRDAHRIEATAVTRAALARAADRGALFAACQMAGVAAAACDLSVAYVKERQQFGRPIGANQAIKHMLAEVQVGIEFLRPVLQAAAATAPRVDALSRAHMSHARLRAAEVVDRATRSAVQAHGAMGYSWETDVHLHLKRGLVLSGAWGRESVHRERVAARALGAGVDLEPLF
jgi:alkylation response protein AidB-like acyl-CoA dehydrogenase